MGLGFKLRTSEFKKIQVWPKKSVILKGLALKKNLRISHQKPQGGDVFTLHQVDMSWDFAELSVSHCLLSGCP